TCFRITALRDVNQFGEIVDLARIDGRQIAPFSFSRLVLTKFPFISRKRRWRPRPHRRRRRIIAAKCDPDRHEKLRRSDESDLHENLPNSPGTSIMFIMAVRKRKCRAQTLIVPFCFPISFSSFWRAGFQELFCRDELHITCLKLWRLASEMPLC